MCIRQKKSYNNGAMYILTNKNRCFRAIIKDYAFNLKFEPFADNCYDILGCKGYADACLLFQKDQIVLYSSRRGVGFKKTLPYSHGIVTSSATLGLSSSITALFTTENKQAYRIRYGQKSVEVETLPLPSALSVCDVKGDFYYFYISPDDGTMRKASFYSPKTEISEIKNIKLAKKPLLDKDEEERARFIIKQTADPDDRIFVKRNIKLNNIQIQTPFPRDF